MIYRPQLKEGIYRKRPRSKKMRNAYSPYLEAEVTNIKRTNCIITDPRRMSRLGMLSQQQMDEIEFNRFLASIGVLF